LVVGAAAGAARAVTTGNEVTESLLNSGKVTPKKRLVVFRGSADGRDMEAINIANWGNREILPEIESGLIVQCEGFRCLGYRDASGAWRNFFNGDMLPSPIRIIESVLGGARDER
jgi:hypothetical protein